MALGQAGVKREWHTRSRDQHSKRPCPAQVLPGGPRVKGTCNHRAQEPYAATHSEVHSPVAVPTDGTHTGTQDPEMCVHVSSFTDPEHPHQL